MRTLSRFSSGARVAGLTRAGYCTSCCAISSDYDASSIAFTHAVLTLRAREGICQRTAIYENTYGYEYLRCIRNAARVTECPRSAGTLRTPATVGPAHAAHAFSNTR